MYLAPEKKCKKKCTASQQILKIVHSASVLLLIFHYLQVNDTSNVLKTSHRSSTDMSS